MIRNWRTSIGLNYLVLSLHFLNCFPAKEMATAHPPLSARILELSQCSVCKETLKNPKCLPCIHTFCLGCLETYGKDRRSGDAMPCPLCRTWFKIPAKGFVGLPNNFFIQDMLKDISIADESRKDSAVPNCDWCDRLANGYCVQCDQHCCQACAIGHGRARFTASHKILSLEEKRSCPVLGKARASSCKIHKEETLKLYCYDCKSAICLMCKAQEHEPHLCKDLEETAVLFGEKLKLRCPELNRCMQAHRVELKELEYEKSYLMKQIFSGEESINKRRAELVRLIVEECKELHQALEAFKNKKLETLQTRKKDLERQLLIIASFTQCMKELNDKGSTCDFACNASDLLTRTEDLVTSQNEFSKKVWKRFEVGFIVVTSTWDFNRPAKLLKNIGLLSFKGNDDRSLCSALSCWCFAFSF